MARLLVTGGSGFLGRHVVRAAEAHGWQVIAPPRSVLDVRKADAVIDTVAAWRPRAVLHLAYRRDDRPSIVEASEHVARAATAAGARLVHLSTDVVFRGRPEPYREDDPTDATMDYGRWKAEAEARVAAACPGAVLMRTSLLYGTDEPGQQASLVRQAASTGHPAFFTDEVRCPTHVDDVAGAALTVCGLPEVTGPLHVASPEPLSRATFAVLLASWLGLDPAGLRTTTLAEAGSDRPGAVILDTTTAAGVGLRCRPASEVLRIR